MYYNAIGGHWTAENLRKRIDSMPDRTLFGLFNQNGSGVRALKTAFDTSAGQTVDGEAVDITCMLDDGTEVGFVASEIASMECMLLS